MIRHLRKLILLLSIVVILSGCWDQRLLKDVKIIHGTGIDLIDKGQIELTLAIQTSTLQTKADMVPVLSEVGRTVREGRMKMDRRISGKLDTSSNKIVILQEDLAKQDVYAPLDVLFRDPYNPLTTRIAISTRAKDVLNVKILDEPFIGEHINEVIQSAEEDGLVPSTSVQLFCRDLFDTRKDAILPIIKVADGTKTLKFDGVALFHDTKMTGKLGIDESIMLQLLKGRNVRGGMTSKVFDERLELHNYVTIRFEKNKTSLQLEAEPSGPIKAKFMVALSVIVVEKPMTSSTLASQVQRLNEELSSQLTREANEVLRTLQKANSDAIGLGMILSAKHHQVWRETNWDLMYPNIELQAEVEVDILEEGIIK